MLVLFDQGTPVPLRQFLAGHTVRTAAEQDWATLGNGALLDAAEAAGFHVLVTTDKNLRYQQNLDGRHIAIVVLGQGQWPLLAPHAERIAEAVNRASAGTYAEVKIPPSV